jgi:hypothetical protein
MVDYFQIFRVNVVWQVKQRTTFKKHNYSILFCYPKSERAFQQSAFCLKGENLFDIFKKSLVVPAISIERQIRHPDVEQVVAREGIFKSKANRPCTIIQHSLTF